MEAVSGIEYRVMVRCTGYSSDPFLPTEGIAHQLGQTDTPDGIAYTAYAEGLVGTRHGWDGEHLIEQAWVEQRIIGDWQPLTPETASPKVES